MEENFNTEFFYLKNRFMKLQSDNKLDKNDVSTNISELLLRSQHMYERLLDYFVHIDKESRNEWLDQSNQFNSWEKLVGTCILNQDNLAGFDYFFGFDAEKGILYFLTLFGVLAVVGIRNSEDIESQVVEAQQNCIEDDEYLFVCTIGLLATADEIYFLNNVEKLIYDNVKILKRLPQGRIQVSVIGPETIIDGLFFTKEFFFRILSMVLCFLKFMFRMVCFFANLFLFCLLIFLIFSFIECIVS